MVLHAYGCHQIVWIVQEVEYYRITCFVVFVLRTVDVSENRYLE